MADKMDVKKLTEYRSQLSGSVIEGISGSIAKLNESLAMISDLQRINEALVVSSGEQEQELVALEANNLQLKNENESLKKRVIDVETKEKQYVAMELSMAKVSALLTQLQQREDSIAMVEKQLAAEKSAFDQEKIRIIFEKTDAEEKANRYLNEKNDAIRSRDVAIAEKNSALKEKEDAEQLKNDAEAKLEELREELELAECTKAVTQDAEELSKVIELMEWYRGYAYALDRKIVNCFKYNKNEDLKSHYYSFLSNPEKLDEIHIHFPDFILEESGDIENSESEELLDKEEEISSESDSREDIENIEEKKDKKQKKEKKDRP